MNEYKIELSPRLAEQLSQSIRERDEFARSAQEKLNLLGAKIDVQVNAIIAMGGRDLDARRGNVTVAEIDGKMHLVVEPPAGPRPVGEAANSRAGFRPPGKVSRVNGAAVKDAAPPA